VEVGAGLGVGVGAALGVPVGPGLEVAVGPGFGVPVGPAFGVAVTLGVGVTVGVLVAPPPKTCGCVAKKAPASTAIMITASTTGSTQRRPEFGRSGGGGAVVVVVAMVPLFCTIYATSHDWSSKEPVSTSVILQTCPADRREPTCVRRFQACRILPIGAVF
jgi:hypothetical protein